MVGTTRSRVSFFMNRFRKLGLIEYNGRIQVNRSLLNVVLHDQFTERNPERPLVQEGLKSFELVSRREIYSTFRSGVICVELISKFNPTPSISRKTS
jgi:hypothetical protein